MIIAESIAKNSSLWELIALLVVIYFLCQPALIKRITRVKIGQLDIELQELKDQVEKSQRQLVALASELQTERQKIENLAKQIDINSPLSALAQVRGQMKAQARNMDDTDDLKTFLTPGVPADQLYLVVVALRERRPVKLIPEMVAFLAALASQPTLGGYRLNIIWTLTSALHVSLLAAVRDGVAPMPQPKMLTAAEHMLTQLEQHPMVQRDRPDNPNKGIRGPIKHCRNWLQKAQQQTNKNTIPQ